MEIGISGVEGITLIPQEKMRKNPRIYQKPIGRRLYGGSDKHEGIHRSVYGSAGQIKYENRRFSAN